jgi:alanine racemase
LAADVTVPDRVGHSARLTVDLAAIVANWRSLAARAAPAECAGVVKADAYGCGVEAVVAALARAGCRTFFVAHLSEARRARAAAPEAVIYVLNGLPPGSAPLYAEARLRPVLGSLDEVAEWRAGEGGPAALHVDTGLNRLGLDPEELGDVPTAFRPSLVVTHFVASEEPDDPANARQIALFGKVRERFPGVPTSLDNSSGVFLPYDDRLRHDLMRPGYALYGGNPTPGAPNPMRPVVRLEAVVLQVRSIEAGETVGYNAAWTAPGPRRIATVSLGYADGYLRSGSVTDLKAGGAALVRGILCPLAGRVSMDLITLDVTAVPDVARGDLATFIGDTLDVDTVAQRLATNGYEVLTSLGRRYERVYLGA